MFEFFNKTALELFVIKNNVLNHENSKWRRMGFLPCYIKIKKI
jgi:hypothetical protein